MDKKTSTTCKYYPALRDWISGFLATNGDMTASQIGNNMLVQQVCVSMCVMQACQHELRAATAGLSCLCDTGVSHIHSTLVQQMCVCVR